MSHSANAYRVPPMPAPLDTLFAAYAAWAFGAAAVFYGAVMFGARHLSDDARARLSLWLQGDYRSSWAEQFCILFDKVFGERHLSFRCFLRSAIASTAAVYAIWFLLDPILGVLAVRATDKGQFLSPVKGGLTLTPMSFDVWALVLVGVLINTIPDYLSLYETRWVLHRFRAVRTVWGQALVLALDFVLTAAIIWLGIELYLLATGKGTISLVEMVALYSYYSVFFYSTFLTSVWAWAYGLSTLFVGLFTRLGLRRVLNVGQQPAQQIALVGAVLVFTGGMATRPLVSMDESGAVPLDAKLCAWFPRDACLHAARLTADERERLEMLSDACIAGRTEICSFAAQQHDRLGMLYQAATLREKACGAGRARECTYLGWMYETGKGVATDPAHSAALYQQGCDAGDEVGCSLLGYMFASGKGVEADPGRAAGYYLRGCEAGHAWGCTQLGGLFETGDGVAADPARAATLYKQGCDGQNGAGCSYLGDMVANGKGVAADPRAATPLYLRGCQLGDTFGCEALIRLQPDAPPRK